jgi:hypothetical protein
MEGKRRQNLFSALVISRTRAASGRAVNRKSSCLISWIEPSPLGGSLAGDGRQGSVAPVPR